MAEATSPKEYQLPRALARRPFRRRYALVGAIVMLNVAGFGWLAYRSQDVDLGPMAGTARRPIVVVNGKATQMPSGDYLAANTLVDTTGCSATNVIAWNGSSFACAAAGGGGGGVSGTPNTIAMITGGGSTAGDSPLVYDGSSTINLLTKGLTIGTSGGSPVLEPLMVVGTITSNSGGTNDFLVDPNGLSYFDSVVGATCTHGSGTDETLAIGFVPNCGVGLRADLDVRTNGNTIISKDSAAILAKQDDTVNTGASPREAIAVNVEQSAGRGTGTGALTTYGLKVDNALNGQTNYGIYVNRGGETIAAGGLTVSAGTTAVQAFTATTINGVGAMSVTGSITASTNLVANSSVNAPTFNLNNFQMFGGSTENDLYFPSAANQNLNIDASGTGKIKFNSNADGIANSGTGGVEFYAGNNGSTVQFAIKPNGHTLTGSTAITTGDLSACGTTPAIATGSTDLAGTITEGTTASGCTLTFKSTYTASPFCVCSGEVSGSTAGVLVGCHTTATTLVIVNASATGNLITYHCTGRSGSS